MADFVISNFAVLGLYGDTDIRVPIRDNRLVIVGLNGLGKTTFLNLFYYFISRQWRKLLEYDFLSLTVTIDDRPITVTREELVGITLREFDSQFSTRESGRSTRLVFERAASDDAFRFHLLKLLTSDSVTPASSQRLLGVRLAPAEIRQLRNAIVHNRGIEPLSPHLQEISDVLATTITAQILYLPTYRRIEKELNIVLPGLEDELRQYRELTRRQRPELNTSYLELVEFGMEDVDRSIQRTLEKQKDTARAELNSLAGIYLRDVLRGQGDEYDRERVAALSDSEVEDILNRVEERTLSETDKMSLRKVISTIRDGGELETSAGYVAHFFVQLLSARQKLRSNEVPVSNFVDVCNRYLEGKQLTYDDVNYVIQVIKNGRTIELAALSSGEKQIVSLFSQVYIGAPQSYIIVIDEPELSLSVTWQQRLLPDLMSSGRCDFMFAVTHSPFIFDNDFEEFAVDLREHVSVGAGDAS